jgi:hypothetical protein
MAIYLSASKPPYETAFTLPTEELALRLAEFLLERNWDVEFLDGPRRAMTPAEHEAAAHLTREFQGSLGASARL